MHQQHLIIYSWTCLLPCELQLFRKNKFPQSSATLLLKKCSDRRMGLFFVMTSELQGWPWPCATSNRIPWSQVSTNLVSGEKCHFFRSYCSKGETKIRVIAWLNVSNITEHTIIMSLKCYTSSNCNHNHNWCSYWLITHLT